MDQPIRDGDHKILGGTTPPLIRCVLVVVIYATTAMLSSENPDSWNSHESIESTAKHKPRRQGNQKYCHINVGIYNRKVEVILIVVNLRNKFTVLVNSRNKF